MRRGKENLHMIERPIRARGKTSIKAPLMKKREKFFEKDMGVSTHINMSFLGRKSTGKGEYRLGLWGNHRHRWGAIPMTSSQLSIYVGEGGRTRTPHVAKGISFEESIA